jgi:hypothetical protein
MAIAGTYGNTPLINRFNQFMKEIDPTGIPPEDSSESIIPTETSKTLQSWQLGSDRDRERELEARTRLIMDNTGKPYAEARADAIQQLVAGRDPMPPVSSTWRGLPIPQTPFPLPEGDPPAMVGGVPTRGRGLTPRNLGDVFSGFNIPSGPGMGSGPIPLGPLGNITGINVRGPGGMGGVGGDFGPRVDLDMIGREDFEKLTELIPRMDKEEAIQHATDLMPSLSSRLKFDLMEFIDREHNLSVKEESKVMEGQGDPRREQVLREQRTGVTKEEEEVKDDKVIPTNVEGVTGAAVAQGEKMSPQQLLESISEQEYGRAEIWDRYKSTHPRFQYMSRDAENLYDRYNKQAESQYAIESAIPGSDFFYAPGTKKRDYGAYIDALFDPNNPSVTLWNASQWRQNLNTATSHLRQRVSGVQADAEALAREGEVTQPTSDILGTKGTSDWFGVLASDPRKVTQWIIFSSLAGENPMKQRYGPQAIRADINRWVAQNLGEMEIPKPTADMETDQQLYQAMQGNSLLKEFIRRKGDWYGGA